MSYFQKCEILNENTFFVACFFHYRVEVFLTDFLMDYNPIDKITYH